MFSVVYPEDVLPLPNLPRNVLSFLKSCHLEYEDLNVTIALATLLVPILNALECQQV